MQINTDSQKLRCAPLLPSGYLRLAVKFTMKKTIEITFAFALILGAVVGWHLSFFSNLQFYKLLNLAGVMFDLLGVVLLSYVILAKEEVQSLIADHVSRYVVIFSGSIPVSMFVASLLASIFGSISGGGVRIFSAIYSLIAMLPIYLIFGSPILEPVGNKEYKAVLRVKYLGAIFIVMGFILQIVAAAADVWSDK